MKTAMEIKNLNFCYGERNILRNVTFDVTKGTFLAIAGPNGAGKTTLLNLLCGQLKPISGSVNINRRKTSDYTIKELSRQIAVVRQEFIPVFDFTVTEVISMARIAYLRPFGFADENDKKIIAEAMQVTDTERFAQRTLGQLSSGERQRVFIARAIAQNTDILLLDEPTNFLDLKHQINIYDLLKKMQTEKQKTIVTVTHDVNLASQYCEKTLLLAQNGNFYIGPTGEVLCREKIEEIFGVKVFESEFKDKKLFIPLANHADY